MGCIVRLRPDLSLIAGMLFWLEEALLLHHAANPEGVASLLQYALIECGLPLE